ncbi:hypothetical protein RND81_11G206400 [Saponaria officinalis]|uniref:Uncharacterized protein n=1 Tax=Saponaria officinalis TaxID=3572 RepID=A0AAW1HPF8_SAPOF
MSQRNLSTEIPQPTSLRRSPRLLQLKLSPKTPNLTSRNISSRKPQIGSTNRAKSSICVNEFDKGSMNCSKSSNGFEYCAKSANGSRRKPNSGICSEVSSVIDVVHTSKKRNDLVDVSVICKTRSRRNSKVASLVVNDGLGMNDCVDFPVTPIAVGEKKCRRVTRSCSGKKGENVEVTRMCNANLKDICVFDGCGGGVELRRCGGRVCETITSGNWKGKEDGDRRILVCGLKKVMCDFRTPVSCKQLGGSFERRITRSVSKRIRKGSDFCGRDSDMGKSGVSCSNVAEKGGSRRVRGKKRECIGKRNISRAERGRKVEKRSIVSSSATLEVEEAIGRDIGVKEKEFVECGNNGGDKLINAVSNVAQGGKLIGVKRKRKEGGGRGRDLGWSNEQEAALQRAYFAAKPSPHFWKKVSKLVPGKSAQECFDKVHSVNLTPLSTRHSSRLKKQSSPSEFLLTGDELLKTIPTKTKRHCQTKRKSHVARKNVRHLLRKYCRDSEADLFSILEPSGNPEAETLQLTPIQASSTSGLSTKCGTISSSGLVKRLSRFSSASKSPLMSPPVLKKVKNMALHEKYIDQLHVRDGKRKSVFSRYSKSVQRHKDEAQNSAQRKVAIKAAKNALVSDARDVIEKFRQSQTNLMEVYSDSEDVVHSDNDEDDIFL